MSAIRPSPNRAYPPPTREDDEEQREIRQRLMQRLAIAVCLILAVGIAITLLNQLESPSVMDESGPAINPLQADQPTHHAAASTPETPSQKVETVEPPPIAEPAAPAAPATDTATSPPTQTDAPLNATVPTEPIANNPHIEEKKLKAVENIGKVAARPHTKPELAPYDPDGASAVPPPSPPPTLAQPSPTPTPQAVVSKPAPSQSVKTPAPPLVLPPQRAAQAPKPTPEHTFTALAAGVLPAGSKGYTVQAGVFQSGANAEKLIEKLNGAGIPARLETRVQVGPFKNRDEAALIMRRLRELGVTPILQTPSS